MTTDREPQAGEAVGPRLEAPVRRFTAIQTREPVWAAQCRQCRHLRQYRGGRIWKCDALRIARGIWRPEVGYAADARRPGAVCGPEGKAFQPAA